MPNLNTSHTVDIVKVTGTMKALNQPFMFLDITSEFKWCLLQKIIKEQMREVEVC